MEKTSTSGEEKAAVLLSILERETAEGLLARLGTERGDRVRAHMQRLGRSPQMQDLVKQALREFDEVLRSSKSEKGPRLRLAQGTERDAVPPAPPAAVTVKKEAPAPVALPDSWEPANLDDPLAALRSVPVERLAAALEGEHARTVALVLDYLEPAQAGEVLRGLPPELRREASLQLGQSTMGNMELVQRIARVLLDKCRSKGDRPAAAKGEARFKKIADMLRALDKADRLDILAALEKRDPQTAARVRENLYQFEDLLAIADRSMQKLLGETDAKTLALALKGAPEGITNKVLGNLSKRTREALTEEMGFLGDVPPAEVAKAQKQLVDIIQRLDQAGELIMTR